MSYGLDLVRYAFKVPNIHKVIAVTTRCKVGSLASGVPLGEKDLTMVFVDNVDALPITYKRNSRQVQI